MAIPDGTIGLPQLGAKPSAPPAGTVIIYTKTDDVIYLQDDTGTEVPFGSSSAITQLTGDVSASGPGIVAATVNFVGGKSASAIATSVSATQAATSANTASTIVARDPSGNFSAGIITATLNGNASSATTSVSFSGALIGDVTGTQGATVVSMVAGFSASVVGTAVSTVNAATSANTASTLVKRDASGNFVAGTISANLSGNVTGNVTGNLTGNVTGNVSGSSSTFTGALLGDVTGTQGATVVSTVGGKTASDIAGAVTAVDAATSANTASTIVERDASGNFTAGVITASLTGNVTGNVSGTASNITGLVAIVNGGTNSAAALTNNKIMVSVSGAIVENAAITAHRAIVSNSNGLPTASVTLDTEIAFVSGVTSSIQGQLNAITGSAITSLTGDGTASGPGAAVFTLTNTSVTGQPLTGYVLGANSPVLATDSILGAIQKLQKQISVSVAGAITALTGDVSATGPGSVAATVNSVGGSSAANIHSAELAANAATTANTANTIVKRDGSGNISGSNFSGSSSGTNTGDVTITSTNSIALAFTSGQSNLSANLNLSADPADTNNLKMTTTIHSGANAGLHVEVPYGTPVQIGTSNNSGSATSVALSDHVHAITAGVVTALLLTGYTVGANTAIAATDSILGAFEKTQGQINAISTSAITALTGDVTATGPGSVAATISVGAVTDTKASLAVKPAVTVVATTNQTMTGAPTIDGQATTAGTSIVLLTAQTTTSQNGPWIVQTGAWTRPTWYPTGGTTQAFQFITTFVRLGTIYQGSVWRQTTAGSITIDTSATTWAVTPMSGNYKESYVIGTQAGSSAVQLSFANALIGNLAWNPGSNQTITLPPNLVGAGSYLSDTGGGVLGWTNPLVNIDGGSPSSNYTSAQAINGGTP